MATSRSSSNSADWRDVVGNLVAFEAINRVRLEIRMSTTDYRGRADLAVVVLAHAIGIPIGDQPPLASANVTCSGTRLKTMEGALIHALYVLDSQLAQLALGEENKSG